MVNENEEDRLYASKFWNQHQTRGLRENMIENIKTAEKGGSFSLFVSPIGITKTDKEKLSAYRVLADEIGYKIGGFKFNKKSYTAQASIKKKHD